MGLNLRMAEMWALFAMSFLFCTAEGIWDIDWLHPGSCNSVRKQENFDINKFLGTWYEIESSLTDRQKEWCSQATISLDSSGKVDVLYKEMLSDGTVVEANFEACPAKRTGTYAARVQVKISLYCSFINQQFLVLSTDYANYALVHYCKGYLQLAHKDYIWILSRQRQLDPAIVQQLKKILTSNEISTDNMEIRNQTMCTF